MDRATAPRLSLVAHCIDVAAVVRALLDLPTWRRRLNCLARRELTPLDIDRLTVFAFLHDTGKAGAGFYAKGVTDSERDAWLRRTGGDEKQCGHTRVVAPLLGIDPLYEPHRRALGIDEMRAWGGGNPYAGQQMLNLWLAAVSHHGDPLAAEELERQSGVFATWLHPIAGYEPLYGLQQLRDTARALWPAAYEEGPAWGEPAQPLIHAFAGLVSLADWIGSHADDAYFPYDLGPQDGRRWNVTLARAREVLRRMCIDVEAIRADLRRRSPSFVDVFGFAPTDMQRKAAEPAWASPTVLEAETGSGKTEAALWRFKTLFEAGEVDALCFLLPTRVAATGISGRLQQFIERLFPDSALRPNTVLAVPGYLRANGEDGTRLAPFRVLWPDDRERDPLYWAAENSKRYFAAAAAAGTVDQFLLSTLQTRHAHLRGSVLLRSLVVVDEVHASDRYMRVLLSLALKRHLAAGGHALLLSATLTSDMRDELLRTGLRRARSRPRESQPVATAEVAGDPRARSDAPDYPRLSAPGQAPYIGSIAENKSIRHTLSPFMRDADEVAGIAADAVQRGARVLVLRNTVRQAVATQRALEARLGGDHPALFRCRGVAALHHGRYAFPDRRVLDAEVERLFGKGAAADPTPCVLCATQTVEISVDCDADFMITDLAPMDVLLQRLGRLHRHRTRDPCRAAGFRDAQCVILVPPLRMEDLLQGGGASRGLGIGSRSAYPDLLCLEATWKALEDTTTFPALEIPLHNRALVERSCSRAALSLLAERSGEAWKEHWKLLEGKVHAQGGQAELNSFDWLKEWREAMPGELNADVRTRLGLDGVELELPQPWDASPFGQRIERLTAPAWMLPPQPGHGPPAMTDAQTWDATLRFRVGDREYIYDRFGLAIDATARVQ